MMVEDESCHYVRPYHPWSPEYSDDRFDGFNRVLQEVVDPNMFIVPNQRPGGKIRYEVWLMDPFALTPSAQIFWMDLDPENGDPLPLSMNSIRRLLTMRKDVWPDHQSRVKALDAMMQEWKDQRLEASNERMDNAARHIAEVVRDDRKAAVYSGGGTNQ